MQINRKTRQLIVDIITRLNNIGSDDESEIAMSAAAKRDTTPLAGSFAQIWFEYLSPREVF